MVDYENHIIKSAIKHIGETNDPVESGGIRVKKISTIDDDFNTYSMNYSYGKDGDGIGYVTYLPYAPELAKELPYSSELPPPIPMYDFVTTTTSIGSSHPVAYGGRTEYEFNVLNEKTEGQAKFGDFYEITSEKILGDNNSSSQAEKYTVHDNLGAIGQLLGVKTFNEKNQLLSNIQNSYYAPGETPDKVGITQESYQTYKGIYGSPFRYVAVSSTPVSYTHLTLPTTSRV